MASERPQLPVRFLPDQYDRVRKAARRRGISRSAFVIEAALAECANVEEEQRLKRQRRGSIDTVAATDDEETTPEPSTGLGIREALGRKRAVDDDDEHDAAPGSAPVVVNVNTGGGGSNDDPLISRLALYIIKGPPYLRDMRKRHCEGIVRAAVTTNEERKQLGERIEAEVAKLDAKRESGASRTLEKLKSFFR